MEIRLIILDTNFLMIPYKYRVDIFSEIERLIPEPHKVITLSSVVKELEGIHRRSEGSEGIAASVALQLIKKENIEVVESPGKVDESILNFALDNKDVIIGTNDKELRKKLKQNKISGIFMRDKGRLELS